MKVMIIKILIINPSGIWHLQKIQLSENENN